MNDMITSSGTETLWLFIIWDNNFSRVFSTLSCTSTICCLVSKDRPRRYEKFVKYNCAWWCSLILGFDRTNYYLTVFIAIYFQLILRSNKPILGVVRIIITNGSNWSYRTFVEMCIHSKMDIGKQVWTVRILRVYGRSQQNHRLRRMNHELIRRHLPRCLIAARFGFFFTRKI